MKQVTFDIAGIGIILYSPPAVEHIPTGANYFQEHFEKALDVARHVIDCQLTAFCTGSPGQFCVRFSEGPPDAATLASAAFKLRLGILVQENTVCVRDLYDLMDWDPHCPAAQQITAANGWYRFTVYSSPPASGVLGDEQVIDIGMEQVPQKPPLRWDGIPQLC